MGLFDRFKLNAVADTVDRGEIDASLAPVPTYPGYDWINGFNNSSYVATREEAMSIPTVARARNILTSSISSVPIVLRDRATGARIDPPRVINTPDPRIPGSAIYAWTAEDLLFTGYAYWQVKELYADTFRIRRVERINPYRVSTFLNSIGTEIEYGNDEGLLNRAGRTIRAGAELERAATMYAREPMPAVVLKSNGASLPPDRIAKLLEAWGTSRRNRSTAFLNSDITIETIGFDPEKMQLAAGRSYIATELARAIGIPAYFVDAESGASMTYSNATSARQSLLLFSLIPLMTSKEERLSMPDFTPSSQVARFDLDVYLRGSAFERAQVYEILNRVGALSVDEIKRKEDLIL